MFNLLFNNNDNNNEGVHFTLEWRVGRKGVWRKESGEQKMEGAMNNSVIEDGVHREFHYGHAMFVLG
jgi:hypothetical protein